MPKRRTRAPVYEKGGSAEVFRAKILSVDRVKWTCTVQSDLDNRVFDGVAIEPTHVNSEGGGQFFLPEANSIVWCCRPGNQVTPFIMSTSTLPKQEDEGDDAEDPNDRRFNRPVVGEGDLVLASSGTARVILRKGGVLEVGASESAKRIYTPLQNIIREFSQSWEHFTGGGRMSMKCRDDDETFGSELTPTEFNFEWREFCEDDVPMIDVRMGRIKAEDDQKIPLGQLGDIVATFNINNRWQVWIDKRGNCATLVQGRVHQSYVGARFEYNDASFKQSVTGTLTGNYGIRVVEVNSTDTLRVGRDRVVEIEGQLTETVSRGVVRQVGTLEETVGDTKRTVEGGVEELILNGVTQTVGADKRVGVTQDSSEEVGGTKAISVAGAGVSPTDTAFELTVANGKIALHSVLGKQVFSVGPLPETATAKITMKLSGAIIMSTLLGTVKDEQNESGVSITTANGKILLDQAGLVVLGPKAAAYGNVVTTLTHPLDRITGTPILGTPNVQAGLLGPPVSGPSSGVNAFKPDLTP